MGYQIKHREEINMPITVTGNTDTTGAMRVSPVSEKSVCILAQADSSNALTFAKELEVFEVFSTSDVIKKLGPSSKAVGMVKILIANGVSRIGVIRVPAVQLEGTYTTAKDAYAAALNVLMAHDYDLLALDMMDKAVINEVKNHLDLAESEDKFRYAVVSVAGVDTSAISTFAGDINHSRIFVVGTDAVDDNAQTAEPQLLAIGVTAAIIKHMKDPALPMNGVEILGLGGVSKVLSKPELKALVEAGVTPIYKTPGGRPAIYRLVTSYTKDTQAQKDPVWQEGTTRFIADDVLSACQARIRTNYKRTKNVARILDSMRTDIIDVLDAKQRLEIIENFDPNTVIVRKDPDDNFGAIIEYPFDVVTPLYTVTINQFMRL